MNWYSPPQLTMQLDDCDELIRSDAKQGTGQSLIGPEGATLAELYAHRGDLHVVEGGPSAAAVGQYL